MTQFERLVGIMAQLRGEGGCPWDREQTHETLKPYMLEECYEALEAVDAGDPSKLCAELGDVLLQVVFHAQVASEQDRFCIEDVCCRISDKLVFRHPHVFGDVTVADSAEVVDNWEQLKRQEAETGRREGIGDGIPAQLPALKRAHALQTRAAKVGFDWDDLAGPVAKVTEELAEVQEAAEEGCREHLVHEVGDLFFAAVNVARTLGVDAEDALRVANDRFARRFGSVQAGAGAQGRTLAEMTLAEMDELWEAAKGEE